MLAGKEEQKAYVPADTVSAEHNESARWQRELQSLTAIATIASRTSDLSTALATALHSLSETLDADAAAVYLLQEGRLVQHAQHGLPLSNADLGEPDASYLAFLSSPQIVGGATEGAMRIPPTLRGEGFRSLASIPLRATEGFIGLLLAASHREDRFSSTQLPYLTTVGYQLAAALQNVRRYEAVRQAQELAETVERVSVAIGTSLDLAEVLERILDHIDRLLPFDSANIMLIEGGQARIHTARGYEAFNDHPAVKGQSLDIISIPILRTLVEEMTPVAVADAQKDTDWVPLPGGAHISSWLGVPLIVQGRVVGLLALDSITPHLYSEQHLRIASAFAPHAAIAIENARLYGELARWNERLETLVAERTLELESSERQLRSRNAELNALNAAARSVTSTLERDAVLAGILRSACALLQVARGTLMIVDETTDELRVVAAEGSPPQEKPLLAMRVGEGLAGWVAETGEALVVEDARQDPRFVLRRTDDDLHAMMILPLQAQGQVIGVLNLSTTSPERHFSKSERWLAEAFAAHAAAALENARLYDSVRTSETRYRAIFETAPIAFLVLDREGHIVDMNRYALKRVPWGKQRSETAADADTFFEDAAAKACGLAQGLRRVLETGDPFTADDVLLETTETDAQEWANVRMVALRDGEGRVGGALLMMELTTQRKQLEAQLMHSERLAAMGQLAASIAHEINNPLAILKTTVQWVQRQTRRGEDVSEELDDLNGEIDRLARLLLGLLDFSRPAAETLAPIEINHLIRSLTSLLKPQLEQQRIRLDLDLDDASPTILGSPDQLKQVLLNLVSNAQDAIPKEGGVLTLSTTRQGECLIIRVRDSGSGISPEDQQRIFEPFFSTKGVKGTGLGLARVYNIVKGHEGEIKIESERGKGTTITISFPLKPAPTV